MFPRVSIHLKTDDKHKTKVIAIPVLNESHFTALHLSLLSHAIKVSDIARREMRLVEMDEEQLMKRVHWFPYESWEFLIYEEFNITKDEAWCMNLLKLSRLNYTLQQVLDIGEQFSVSQGSNPNKGNDNSGKVSAVLQAE